MYAPRGLDRDGRRAWRAAVAALEAQGRDVEPLLPRLELYARAAGRLVELDRAWRSDGATIDAEGSTGQRRVDPVLAEIRVLEAHVDHLADGVFGAASAGVGGWQRGHARSPDRQYQPPRRRAKVVPLHRRELDELIAAGDRDA